MSQTANVSHGKTVELRRASFYCELLQEEIPYRFVEQLTETLTVVQSTDRYKRWQERRTATITRPSWRV